MVKTVVLNILVFFMCVSLSQNKKPPASYIKPCSLSAPDFDECCLAHGIEALPYLLKGDREYRLPNFNPFIVPKVNLETSGIKIAITDLHIYGFDTVDLKQVKFNFEEKKFIISMVFETLNLIGDYEMDGKLIMIPIHGTGKANLTVVEVTVDYIVKYKFITKDGEEYFQVDTSTANFDCKNMKIDLSDIFGDNREIAYSTNKALNDNWRDLFQTFKPIITDVIVQIGDSIINAFGDTVPFADVFLE